MARLTRKNMKVFAANASNNGVFGSLEAGNPTVTNDVEQIQGLTAWGAGWNAATLSAEKLPPLEEFQGVQYVTTYQQAYLMQEGMPEWNANVTYYKGSLTKKVTTTGFQIYNSLTDDNTNHQLSDTTNWKLVMDSDNLYALDNAVVHIAGAETITGEKTFTQNVTVSKSSGTNLILKMTDATQGTPPASGEYNGFLYFRDSSNNGLGAIKFAYQSSGVSYMNMYAMKHDLSGNNPTIGVYCDANNVGYATAPSTRSDRNNGTDIVTRNWIPDDTRIVHTTGNESIAGTKTFQSNPHIVKSQPQVDCYDADFIKGTAPSANKISQITFKDSAGTLMGAVQSKYFGNTTENQNAGAVKLNQTFLQVEKANAGTDDSRAYLILAYPASSRPYATAPHSGIDGSGKIVTTVSQTTAAKGGFKLGNGLIINWGHTTPSSSTISFAIPFTSTNYMLANCNSSGGGNHTGNTGYTQKNTGSFVMGYGYETDWIAIGY